MLLRAFALFSFSLDFVVPQLRKTKFLWVSDSSARFRFLRGSWQLSVCLLSTKVELGFLEGNLTNWLGFLDGNWDLDGVWCWFWNREFVNRRKDVLLSVYFGQERSTWDYMDSCTFRKEAPKESGGRYWHWSLCRSVRLSFTFWYYFLFLFSFNAHRFLHY